MRLLYITNGINGSGGLERVLSVKASMLTEDYHHQVSVLVLNNAHLDLFYTFSPKINFYSINVTGNPIKYFKSWKNGIQKVVDDLKPNVISVCDDGLKGFFIPKFLKTDAKIFSRQGARFGLVQFEFMLGAFLLKYKWLELFQKFSKWKRFSITTKNCLGLLLILGLIVFHAFVPSLFISPFIALVFIIIWMSMSSGKFINRILDFVAPHSTNIWLVHSFFYVTYFKDFIFGARYSLPIFLLLVGCSLLSSYVINYFYKKLVRLV